MHSSIYLILICMVFSGGCSQAETAPNAAPVVPPAGDVILVANQKSSSVTMIEVKTGRTVAHIPVGAGPHELAVSGDGRTAIVPLFGNNFLWGAGYGKSVAVIDIASASLRRKIELGENTSPYGAVFLADNRTAIVTSSDACSIILIDTEAGGINNTIPLGNPPYMITASPDGQFAYTTNPQTDTISELDLNTQTLRRTFRVSGEPGGVVVSGDRDDLWVARTGADALSVVDLKTGEITKSFEGIDVLRRAAISPDGKKLLATSITSSEVRLFDAAEKREIGRIPLGEGISASGASFAADSKTAYVTSPHSNMVLELDLDQRSVRRTFATESSPDGIVYVSRAEK